MSTVAPAFANLIETERGLSIPDTRVTLYDVLGHLKAGWAPHLILHWLPITAVQLDGVLDYIAANGDAVEADYQMHLQSGQSLQDYWQARNHDRLAAIANLPSPPEQAAVHAKLQAWKAKLGIDA
jgi:uncharacterized protein (DUF433 family)